MILALLLSLSAGPPAPRVDLHGDPLPYGAVARLGTVRLHHGYPIAGVAVSADGKKIASCAADHTVRIWDFETGKPLAVLGAGPVGDVYQPSRWIHTVAISPDGTRAVGLANDAIVHCYDTATGREVWKWPLKSPLYLGNLTFTPDGKLLMGIMGQSVFILNAATGAETRRLWGVSRNLCALAISPDGKELATGAPDGTIKVYRTSDWNKRTIAPSVRRALQSLAYSSGGKKLAAGDTRGFAIYDPATLKQLRWLETREESRHIAFLAGDKHVLTCGQEPSPLRIWDAETGKPIRSIEHRLGWIGTLALCPDRRTVVVSAARRAAVFKIGLKTGKAEGPYPGHTGNVRHLAFADGGRRVLSGGEDGTLRQWDAATGKQLWCGGSEGKGAAIALHSAAGAVFVYGKGAEVWMAGAARPGHLLGHGAPGEAQRASFSPDGKFMVTGGYIGQYHLWGLEASKGVRAWQAADKREPDCLAFGPGGLVGSVTSHGDFVLWSAASGERLRGWAVRSVRLLGPTFSRDGRYVACGASDGRARVWEAATGQLLHEFPVRPGFSMSVAFSPDGRALAAGEWNGLRVYSLADGAERGHQAAHGGDVMALVFSDDGKRLASGGSDATALVWDVKKAFRLPKRETLRKEGVVLAKHLRDLEGADHKAAYRAIWALAGTGDQAVNLLAGHLRPIRDPDAKTIAALIAKLEEDDEEVRRRAQSELEAMRHHAEKAVREALKKAKDPDVKLRLGLVLRSIAPGAESRGDLRDSRAVQVLELVNAPAARRLLGELAKGAEKAPRTKMARAALRRLQAR